MGVIEHASAWPGTIAPASRRIGRGAQKSTASWWAGRMTDTMAARVVKWYAPQNGFEIAERTC